MKRFLFIFALVFTLLLPCTQKVFAAEIDTSKFSYNQDTHTISYGVYRWQIDDDTMSKISAGYDYCIIIDNSVSSSELYILTFNPEKFFLCGYYGSCKELYLFTNKKSSSVYDVSETSFTKVLFDGVTFTKNSFGVIPKLGTTGSTHGVISNNDNCAVLYSSADLYSCNYYDGAIRFQDTVFFPQTPRPVPLILGMQEEIMNQIMTQENPLKEILTILPMVIPCWVGFVALRKALRLLATILRTA